MSETKQWIIIPPSARDEDFSYHAIPAERFDAELWQNRIKSSGFDVAIDVKSYDEIKRRCDMLAACVKQYAEGLNDFGKYAQDVFVALKLRKDL